MTNTCTINKDCQRRFENIESRLKKGDDHFGRHDTEIAVMQTNLNNLVKSLSSLTKALWGICGTTLVTLFGFLMWYIKSL